MKKIINVENLIKRYKKAENNAVDDISFYVEEGAFFSLLGPNGAGKTTTLSILTTTLTKTSGKVTIVGFDLDKNTHNIRRNIGVIFQNPSLDLNLTAEENVRIHVILYGIYPFRPTFQLMPEKYKRKVQELSSILGIEKEIFKPIKTFSGGMKRKLEIVRSLTHEPKVLFLDEPTTGLDPLSRKNLWEYLMDVKKKQKTTIFLTTHYLDEAEEADYICIVNRGKIISRGTPREIKQNLIDEYIMIDAKDREKLTKELSRREIVFSLKGPFKIDLKNRTVHEVVREIETPLTRVSTHTPSLEEAYLEIISQSDSSS